MGKTKIYFRSNRFLVELLSAGGEVVFHLVGVPMVKGIAAIFALGAEFNKREFNRTIKRLAKNNMIGVSETNEGTRIYLKKPGKEKAIEFSLSELEIKRPKQWDGKWRVVIFDIPKKFDVVRRIFQRTLKNLGFLMIQKSVYIHPFDCKKEIEYIRSAYSAQPYIKLLLVEKLEDESILKKKFDL